MEVQIESKIRGGGRTASLGVRPGSMLLNETGVVKHVQEILLLLFISLRARGALLRIAGGTMPPHPWG